MKKYKILRAGFILTAIVLFISAPILSFGAPPAGQMYYEIKIYRLSSPAKGAVIDTYLKDAFIPAMHRAGIKTVGVFKPVEADTAFGKMVYVFIPYKTIDHYFKVSATVEKDPVYQQSGKDFLDAPYNDPPYTRYESVLLKAFSYMPQFRIPKFTTPMSERIYELRSYESPTDVKATKKIKMFNEGGEMAIFQKIGANAVFYGQVLFGSKKPRLMYMTTYENSKSREEHWVAFRNSSEWKIISALEEYKNTVSKANPYLLHPADYSDF